MISFLRRAIVGVSFYDFFCREDLIASQEIPKLITLSLLHLIVSPLSLPLCIDL